MEHYLQFTVNLLYGRASAYYLKIISFVYLQTLKGLASSDTLTPEETLQHFQKAVPSVMDEEKKEHEENSQRFALSMKYLDEGLLRVKCMEQLSHDLRERNM